ncbi:MAG: isoaspartyl peptidase/L-asparaginase [Rhodothermaceae bacterium]|nr:isoaspartyl peptidase/L-asparaginase [Rhodothermaceae bacterium]
MELVTGEVSKKKNRAVVLVHGGAWDIPDEECEDHEKGLDNALDLGAGLLQHGSAAAEVVVQVLSQMENSGIFDAGCGAVLNEKGEVELDAGMMCGDTKQWGAVAGVKVFRNPVKIAQKIASEGKGQYCFLANTYAERFAREAGFKPLLNKELICAREKRRYDDFLSRSTNYHTSHPFMKADTSWPRGTIGCIALDSEDRLAAATSTGGTPFRMAGRIGDSPLPGCGFFANRTGAASATGWGEAIASVSLCREAVFLLEQGMRPIEAVSSVLGKMYSSVENLDGQGATGGLILLNSCGEGAWGYTTPRMARGWVVVDQNQRFIKVT